MKGMNNGVLTNDLILRTVTENNIKEIARMWEYPKEITLDKVYEAPNVIIG